MVEKGDFVLQVSLIAEKTGLTEITPIELSKGGNLIIHLAPHPIVARIATVSSKEDSEYAYKVLDRELRVARHLQSKSIPALSPSELIDAGPYDAGGAWMTLWRYVPPTQLQPPSPSEAVELVNRLSIAMKDFSGDLPVLGVWKRACQSANKLRSSSDQRIQTLLSVFQRVNERMCNESNVLIPCHGDAHARNLLPSPEGWIWSDFEDVSLMPAYWDLASFVGNHALLGGIQQPTFKYILDHFDNGTDLKAFGFAIIARTLMSTLGNLDFSLAGHGDLEFATRQLELAEDFVRQVEIIMAGCD
ncbi:Phosphotransferase enzyme family protein [Paenibacillus sp. UNCCL117]|uniref:phosphotransferase n=1 Tax=unclassified Paenibacillus TaxID=185978 RepID=UPI0008917FEB|nr:MULTISPECIES: phosphotransferase [unclassified Paenibacillus]SDC26521.1 Phosphotransferase enzyme family protein [Paenibacillus sp. cl123]SFW20112.1 Phosphotransferase enzyme family protein [Paenibacillus sp. UNCCL117]